MSWASFLFLVFGAATVICSVGVVVTRDIVRSAVWLLFALSSTAGLFFFLGADFVGATQLLVYVGGTLVLLVFGVMLTARGPFVRMETKSGEWTISAIVGVVLLGVIVGTLLLTNWPQRNAPTQPGSSALAAAQSPTSVQLGMYFLGVPPGGSVAKDAAHPSIDTARSSDVKRMVRPSVILGYLLPFEIVSVHLLVVLVGAAYLARAKRRRTGAS